MGRILRVGLVAALLLSLAGPLAGRPAEARTLSGTASPRAELAGPPGMRLLVRFALSASAEARDRAVRSVGGAIETELDAIGVSRVLLPGGAADAYGDGDAVAAFLARDPAVLDAELDRPVRLAFTPNDTYYLTDPFVGLGQWGIRKASVDRAWDTVRGSASVTVAVVDTGIDPAHPDLAASTLPGVTFLSAPSPGCGTGANDDDGHGTHVAGVIAAAGNNGQGIAGVAFGVRILPVKALDCAGVGAVSDIALGITWATDHGARVINVSLGSASDSSTLHSAVQYAASHNVLVVAAAGNCGQLGGSCTSVNEVSYPAAYPEVLAVAATDVDDTRATFSTQATYVGIAAPGLRIVSTTPTYDTYISARGGTKSYGVFSGTSQATSFVAGVAALLLSQDPTLSARAVSDRLKATADDLGTPGTDTSFGAGRVNALRAVSAAAPTFGATYDTSAVPKSVAATAVFSATVRATNTSSFAWTSAGTNPVRLTYQWTDLAGAVLATGPRIPLTADVPVGGTASVTTAITAPSIGARLLRFDLVQEGVASFSTKGVLTGNVTVVVVAGQTAASYSVAAGATSLTVGVPATLPLTLTNTGTASWSAAGPTPVRASYHWMSGGVVAVWDGARTALAADVAPGTAVSLALAVIPPATPGAYTLRIDLVQEGVAWFSSLGVTPRDVPMTITTGLAATYIVGTVPIMLPGARIALPVTARNDGTSVWTASGSAPVHLAVHVFDGSGSVVLWDGERTALSADVAPGSAVATSAFVAAPLAAGIYRVRVDLVREGVAWFSGLGVAPGEATLLVNPDFRATLPAGPLSVSRAQPAVTLTIANSSTAAWTTGGAVPIAVAAHWLDGTGGVLVWDGPRTPLPRTVAPGESVTLSVSLGPVPPGAAAVAIDLVADGLRWFGAGANRPVTLVP